MNFVACMLQVSQRDFSLIKHVKKFFHAHNSKEVIVIYNLAMLLMQIKITGDEITQLTQGSYLPKLFGFQGKTQSGLDEGDPQCPLYSYSLYGLAGKLLSSQSGADYRNTVFTSL
jgi:hypothetical protein